MALGSGGRVRLVARPGWTKRERELYAGREGKLCGIRPAGATNAQLVEIIGGPCDGERRWFTDAEIEAL